MMRIELIKPAGGPRPPELDRVWSDLLDRFHSNINAIFASPVWHDYLTAVPDGRSEPAIAVVRDDTDRSVGVVPILITDYKLHFAVSLRKLWTVPLRTANILGSLPMVPDDPELHARLLESLFDHDPRIDCIAFDSLPTASDCYRH